MDKERFDLERRRDEHIEPIINLHIIKEGIEASQTVPKSNLDPT